MTFFYDRHVNNYDENLLHRLFHGLSSLSGFINYPNEDVVKLTEYCITGRRILDYVYGPHYQILGDLQMVTDTQPSRESQGGSYGHENEIVCDFSQLNSNLQVRNLPRTHGP